MTDYTLNKFKRRLRKAIFVQKIQRGAREPVFRVTIVGIHGTVLYRGPEWACKLHRKNTIKSIMEALAE